MPCAPLMKPKLGFSIESLVGGKGDSEGRASPPLADTCSERGVSPPTMPPSPLSPGPPAFSDLRTPLAMRALLEDKPLPIQRPQPINGATQRLLQPQEVSLPPSLLAAAKLPAGLHHALLPPHLNLAALPQLQGLPAAFPPQLNPLMMGGGPGLAAHLPREYPLYPWLLSRHGRVFPHGLPSEYTLPRFFQLTVACSLTSLSQYPLSHHF
ncbi:hypothetical protein Pmani_031217 [Petrolisthes manimaculis]|uniref:Uncharacterized protein n=1 Tax=Petrolisthes manimaculis TaxID=1843537 RepID=A0AAE1NUB9_9EUCA|nr:hypothetical protein Pmani_031217 [Petrolisthes manimaculis]